MTISDVASMSKFDESREQVRKEIFEGFFDEHSNFVLEEQEFRRWLADRAVDELKLVVQLSSILSASAHLLPSELIPILTRQMADESRHYTILGALVPRELQDYMSERVEALPESLARDEHWQLMLKAAREGNPYSAILDINIVHEGYSAAAIEALSNVPLEDVRAAYREIGADEERHYQSGQDLLTLLTDIGGAEAAQVQVLDNAHERAGQGTSMFWSWP